MRLIQSNCRIQFTAEDLAFIQHVLQPGAQSTECLERLLGDEETRDVILDDDKLLRAVLERGGCLPISPHLYFYILVRQVFRRAELSDRKLADYVAELLAEFSRTERTQLRVAGAPLPLDYVCDMLGALQTTDDTTRFFIRAHVGNYSLFVTGIFPERIRHRMERRGAPGLEYYEAMGRSSFREAGDHRLARHYALDDVFQTLAERFQETRQALNDLGDRLVCLNDPDYTPILPP